MLGALMHTMPRQARNWLRPAAGRLLASAVEGVVAGGPGCRDSVHHARQALVSAHADQRAICRFTLPLLRAACWFVPQFLALSFSYKIGLCFAAPLEECVIVV